MVPDFVPIGDDAPRCLWQVLDVGADHEKGCVQIVVGEYVENSLGVR
jgi:hypothetical protein